MACAFLPVEEKLNLPGPISEQHQQSLHAMRLCDSVRLYTKFGDRQHEQQNTFHGGSKDEHKTSLCFMVTNNTIRIRRPQWETSTGNAYYKYMP